MQIDPNPPGLICRRTFPINDGRWVLQEEWDISVPGCPMIQNPWLNSSLNAPQNIFIRQLEMSAEEYAAYARNQSSRRP